MKRYVFIITVLTGVLSLISVGVPELVAGVENLAPPLEPEVAPLIASAYTNDLNRNKMDDALESKAAAAMSRLKVAVTPEEKIEAQTLLEEYVEVELIFDQQITQRQIDEFLGRGGEIAYIYKAVSYGWNGRISLGEVNALPSVMGAELVLVQEAKPVVLHLDMATRTGRVRPVWAPGFAGSPSGYDGDDSITIAIVDTGIDAAHSDLSGRQRYWRDFSSDVAPSPVDMIGHGSHVAGIALGTGAASGSGTGTLYFTDTADLTGVPSDAFYPFPIGLPDASITFSSTAAWNGGGSTSLYQVYHTKGTSGGWTAVSPSATGSSPLTETNTFTGSSSRAYSTALLQNAGDTVQDFVIVNSVTSYPGVGDGFNKLRGVAPACWWAAAKVFQNTGEGITSWVSAAIDDLVSTRVANNIKVMNLSLGADGDPGIDTALRQKVNTAVTNGIVVVVSAGNDGLESTSGGREIDDPGRAAVALTVAACNDEGQLTSYSSHGFSSPGSGEDYKPDISAPGGSAAYYTDILSVDSGSADGAFTDQRSNDYASMQGTSMASPFAAGAAALVIDAMQQQGITWDFYSSQHARYVKMLLCATATETNTGREGGSYNPTLQRASGGPSGFPAGKDPNEGYGILNPDAAVEAVTLTYTSGSTAGSTLGPGVSDRRAWARKVELTGGAAFKPTLNVPPGGDFDLYLCSATPSSSGTPAILASSTLAGNDINEFFSYVPPADTDALLVVKRVSGSGAFSLTTLENEYVLTVNIIGSGTVTKVPNQATYHEGDVVQLTANAATGWAFIAWSGDLSGSTNPQNLTITRNMSVTATFTQNAILTVATTFGGIVTKPGMGSFQYSLGSVVSLKASPAAGWDFINWSGNTGTIADVNSAVTTIVMNGNYTIQANFELIQIQGEVIGWGNNSYGQANIPLEKTLFTAVSGGYYHILGLKTDGSLSATGRNNYGQCNVPEPNTGFTAVAAGGWHSLGLKSDGSIAAWGHNGYSQSSVPWPNAGFTAIAAGYSHSLGLKSDGSIVAWGRNDYGQCDVPAPNTNFVAIAAGSYHSLGLKSNGSIVAWGYNYNGQCDVPLPNSGFTAVAAGREHSLARKSDGSIVAWGRNIYGQCTVPSPNSGFNGVAAGAYHSIGLKTNGSIVAFGANNFGQSSMPSPNTGYMAVAAGGEHSLAIALVDVSSGDVNYGVVFQQIEGFGGAAVYEPADPLNRSYREEVFDMLFRDLGIDLLRIRNTYGYPDGGYNLYATGQVVAEAKQRNPNMKLLLTPWSPAAYLKSNDNINGGGTLKKDGQGNYIYPDYADWWADSIEAFANIGVHPDYISIQNEPDIETDYDSMKFRPVEDSEYAGYDQAFEAVYQELFNRMGDSMPKMIGPDTTGYSVGEEYYSPRGSRDYIDNLINQDHCYAFAFHPYGDAWGAYGYDNPDFLIYSMPDYAAEYGYKPLIMTEFCRLNKTPDFNDAVNLGWHIHNFLTYMRVKAYYHWTLFRGWGTGGMINVADPNFYIVRDLYWFLKGYAHFTDPGWFVLGSSAGSSNLRITAFKNPEGTKLTVVIVNVSNKGVNLTLNVKGFSPASSKIYRSSASQHWSYIGAFEPSQALPCPRRSITTISLSISLFGDCSEALAAGHRLAADIGGDGDCYVDYFDFVTLAEHWLSDDCIWPDNCEGADFEPADGVVNYYDLGDFVSQWTQCNDPENPDCMLN